MNRCAQGRDCPTHGPEDGVSLTIRLPSDLFAALVQESGPGLINVLIVNALRDHIDNRQNLNGTEILAVLAKSDSKALAQKVTSAVQETGSVAGAAKLLATSTRNLWRLIKRFSIAVETKEGSDE